MSKRARKNYRNLDIGKDDDFDDLFEDDFDFDELSRDIYSTEWGENESDSRISPRRKIERRRDLKRLYSQLDEWEGFGKNADSYI